MTGQPVRLGILGCSDIADRKFLPAAAAVPIVRIVGIASRCIEKARRFAAVHNCQAHSYESLLEDRSIELVYVSLPNHLHEQWTIAALEQGKHVICEKPLGLTLDSVERMVGIARQRGLLLYENIMFLHHPQHQAVRDHLHMIGPIRLMRAVFGFSLNATDNFRMNPLSGGGSFYDQSRYPLAAGLFFLTGELQQFQGIAPSRNGLNIGMHGTALSSAREVFQFSIDFNVQYEAFYELVGTTGRIRVDRAFTTPADMTATVQVVCGNEDLSFSVPPHDHFRLMLEHVCLLIRGSRDFSTEHGRNLKLAALAEKMRQGCITTEVD